MKNYWFPTEQQRALILPILHQYNDFIRTYWKDCDENSALKYTELNFTNWPINPTQLEILFKEIGYETIYHDHSGWECNFSICMKPKDGAELAFGEKCIIISGCAMTFELKVNVQGVDF